MRASRIGGRVVIASIPDGDAYTLSASDARRRGLKIKFVRRMGDDYSRAIDLVTSGQGERESDRDAPRELGGRATGL